MKKSLLLLPFAFWLVTAIAQQSPDKLYGPLFKDVQMQKIFPDQKTFVDCIPRRAPSDIMADYDRLAKEPTFDLKAFVASNFTTPADPDDIRTHVKALWRVLHREASYWLCPIRTPCPVAVSMRSISGILTSPCLG